MKRALVVGNVQPEPEKVTGNSESLSSRLLRTWLV